MCLWYECTSVRGKDLWARSTRAPCSETFRTLAKIYRARDSKQEEFARLSKYNQTYTCESIQVYIVFKVRELLLCRIYSKSFLLYQSHHGLFISTVSSKWFPGAHNSAANVHAFFSFERRDRATRTQMLQERALVQVLQSMIDVKVLLYSPAKKDRVSIRNNPRRFKKPSQTASVEFLGRAKGSFLQ